MTQRLAGIFILAVAAVLFGVNSPVALAASGLSVGPFLQDVDLTKGQASSSFQITLGNNTQYTLPMLVSIVDFGAADDNGGVNFLPNVDDLSHKYGLASWMHTDKSSLVMKPHSTQQIKVTVDNKESMSPGGHYGAVIFKLDQSQLDPDQSEVSFLKAVSTLVLAKKGDGGKAELTYGGMTWDGAPFALPSSVHLKLYNSGNIHTSPLGDVTLTNMFGQVVSTDKLNPSNTIILPESEREYPVAVSQTSIQWIPGTVTITARYKVDATSSYQTHVEKFFVISPWSFVVIIVLIILLILSINYRIEIINFFRKLRGKPLLERKERNLKLGEK